MNDCVRTREIFTILPKNGSCSSSCVTVTKYWRKLINKKEKTPNKLKTRPYPHFVISFLSFSSIWNSKSPSSTWTPTFALELHAGKQYMRKRTRCLTRNFAMYRAPKIDLRRVIEYDGKMKEMHAQDNLFSTQILIIWKVHYRILTISCTSRISTWVPLLRIRKQSFVSVSVMFRDRAFWPIATRQWALANNKVFDHAGL